jgi:hypothetical protein
MVTTIPLTYETANSSIENEHVTLSDNFATGWRVPDYAGFEAGDTAAVFEQDLWAFWLPFPPNNEMRRGSRLWIASQSG